MRNLCTTLHTGELLKTWASCCVVDLPLTFSYERIPEEKLQDRWSPQRADDGRWWSARGQSQNTNQGTADHGGTEIHVALLNNDDHQPGFVLAFSTNYCSTSGHNCGDRDTEEGAVCLLQCTNRQTPLITALTLWSLFMVVIVVTVCVPSRITLPMPCFYKKVSLLTL